MPTCSEIADLQRPAILADGQLTIPESTDGLTLADFVQVLTRYREINESLGTEGQDRETWLNNLTQCTTQIMNSIDPDKAELQSAVADVIVSLSE